MLFTLATRYETLEEKDYGMFVFTVTNAHGTYALKIKNHLQFLNNMANVINNDEFYNTLEENYLNLSPNSSIQDQERIFINFITEDYDLGIDLFKANNDLSEWNKLIAGTNNIIPNPCN